MRINGDGGSAIILKEIGYRIKQYRITSNMTQEELADKCRFSVSTVVRIENGEDSKFSNYIKIMYILNLASNIEMMIPEIQPNYEALYEGRPERKRVKHSTENDKPTWIWEEDKAIM